MLLNDLLKDRWIAERVPRALWIHDGDRSTFTDSQAVSLGAQDSPLFGQPKLFETTFQEFPGLKAALLVATFRVCLIATEKDVPSGDGNADAFRNLLLRHGCLAIMKHQ